MVRNKQVKQLGRLEFPINAGDRSLGVPCVSVALPATRLAALLSGALFVA